MGVIVDWRAHWLKVGCTVEDTEGKLLSSSRTLAMLITLVSIVLGLAPLVPPADVDFSVWRTVLSATNALAIGTAWAIDTYGTPPAERGTDPQVVASTIGPLAYFTKQSLCIQTTHALLSFGGEAFGSPFWRSVLTLVHQSACSVAAVAFSLVILFLKLNWLEENWRNENLFPWCRRGVPMYTISLLSHILPGPVALVDIALAKRPELLGSNARVAERSAVILLGYIVFYCTLTNLNYRWCGGRYPYPFMRALTTNTHWLLFVVVLAILVNFAILPTVLLAKALNISSDAPLR